MKKAVAIGIAGAAAVVVAAWRQVQRDNTLATDPDGSVPAPDPAPPETPPAGQPAPAPADGPALDESSSKAELYEAAQDLEIEGRSKMSKAELLEAIRAAR